MSPGAYIFQRPFLRGLFLEGLIFAGAYLWREICVSKSIGLALEFEGNLPFLLCFTLYLRAIAKYKPLGGLYLEGRFNGGAYFRNFTVSDQLYPGKAAEISRRHQWFRREMTPEERTKKFHTDDASLPRSGSAYWMKQIFY